MKCVVRINCACLFLLFLMRELTHLKLPMAGIIFLLGSFALESYFSKVSCHLSMGSKVNLVGEKSVHEGWVVAQW